MNVNHVADIVFAAAGPPGGGAGSAASTILMFAAMAAIFYFLIIRPQQKQKRDREAMLGAIKRGDRVITTSGLHGTVTGLNEHTVLLRVADQVKLEFERSAVARIVVEGQSDKDA